MLNVVWSMFIIVSFIYGIFSGRVNEINESIFDSCKQVVELCINLLGTMCLWSGMMGIASKTSLINKITNAINPIMRFLFPDIRKEEKAYKEMSMNIVANIMGLGNAATPLGLKAMESLQECNNKKDILSNSMAMFIVLNTASLQIIPTTVIALRSSLKSADPTKVIIPIWVATCIAAVFAVTAAKIFMKKW